MKRVTLNQLAQNEYGWFGYLVTAVYNGNIPQVKDDLRHMSKKETLKVIQACVNELVPDDFASTNVWHDLSVRSLYTYAMSILEERL